VDLAKFKRFLELTGHKVVQNGNHAWCEISPMFYELIPFYETIDPSQAELTHLLRSHRMLGISYRTKQEHIGKTGCIYLCDEPDYSLDIVHRKMRNKVRQGLRNCVVREIEFDYLYRHARLLNEDTLDRQNRDDPLFSSPAQWSQFCKAGERVDGASAWGAFVDDELAAYLVTFITGEYCSILYQFSRTELLPTKANNALAYEVTRRMLSRPKVKCVSYGRSSIRGDLSGLDEYKTRLGYKRYPVNLVMTLHPWLDRSLTGPLGNGLLWLLDRMPGDNDLLKRVRGVIDIAQES